MDKLTEGKKIFDIEMDALRKTRDSLDEIFVKILDMITECNGKVIVTGMGKSGHVATKIAATLSSLGTASFYLHPAEALHGDLGMISKDDVIIVISYSGESDEIVGILPSIKLIGAKLIGITGKGQSTLAKEADIVQILPEFKEACHLGLAPTSSTAVELCYGDALAVVASQIYGFEDIDFGRIHPAGTLGKKLRIRVGDIMAKGKDNAIISDRSTLKDAIVELSKKKLGIVNIEDNEGNFKGIITGGDVYRALSAGCDIYTELVQKFIKKSPYIIDPNCLAIEALSVMNDKKIINLPVLQEGKLVGTIIMQDILAVGIN